jgi:hypothetical protein
MEQTILKYMYSLFLTLLFFLFTNKQMKFETLPLEVLYMPFLYLEMTDIGSLIRTNKYLRNRLHIGEKMEDQKPNNLRRPATSSSSISIIS